MYKQKFINCLAASVFILFAHAQDAQIVQTKYNLLPIGAIEPEGWLKEQLTTMDNNSTGHLDEYYAKLKNDNAWLGGTGDGGEETPYWLDGAVPLAYLLNDKALQSKVLKYINWTLNNQRSSGYFGPITKWEIENGKQIDIAHSDKGEDWWPKMIMLKVLMQYYSATKDARVPSFMKKYFTYQAAVIDKMPLSKWSEWAHARGPENILAILWLYRLTGDKTLPPLAIKIEKQSYAWSEMFGGRNWVINAATLQNDQQWMTRHGVNVAMGIKEPALDYLLTGNKKYIQDLTTGWNDIMTLHGLPNGVFSADEDLHGNLPTQGTELCAIVETMFSMENCIAITGNLKFADALERMAFNALPPQTTDDYNNKQYFQVANQVDVNRGVYDFSLPFDREMNNVYGARSGYTCCLANMHQGWPKFTQNLWYKTSGDGIAALVYAPNKVSFSINSTTVTIHENTNYPFTDEIKFEIQVAKNTTFPLQLRIPSWCKNPVLKINGSVVNIEAKEGFVALKNTWKNGDVVELKLPMEITTSNWGRNSRTVEYGPLVYGLRLNETFTKAIDAVEGDYYTVTTNSTWNYGLTRKIIEHPGSLQVVTKPWKSDFKWNQEHAPIEIIAKGKRIPEWTFVKGKVADQPVTDRNGIYKGKVNTEEENITLVPYGFTKLRVVAFPVVE